MIVDVETKAFFVVVVVAGLILTKGHCLIS
jgi:hypothetical protein